MTDRADAHEGAATDCNVCGAIIEDFREGKMYRPTTRERAEAAERERDEANRNVVMLQHARRMDVHKMFDSVADAIGYSGKDWDACVSEVAALARVNEELQAALIEWAEECEVEVLSRRTRTGRNASSLEDGVHEEKEAKRAAFIANRLRRILARAAFDRAFVQEGLRDA
jgi:flagellar biosynthesis regulator FlaF